MKFSQARWLLFLFLALLIYGCANVVPPSGGKKDTRPPKLLSVTPADSQLNTRVTRLEMRFDEFINLSNASAEIQMSPLLSLPLTSTAVGKKVIIKIPDTLLKNNTTYRLSFGNAIRDLHEDNPFRTYTYSFSTGAYFDSLNIGGSIINASTGLPDTGAYIMLYDAGENDSAIVRQKPLYAVKVVMPDGSFALRGLPQKQFKAYALRDGNANLIYDGGDEQIAFLDSIVTPQDSIADLFVFKMFKEPVDSSLFKADSTDIDSLEEETGSISARRNAKKQKEFDERPFTYGISIDTSDVRKRTQDIMQPVHMGFSRVLDTFYVEKMHLSYDSADIQVEASFTFTKDTIGTTMYSLRTDWKENTVYTLKILKGFAVDTSGRQNMPSSRVFRTKSDEDYSKLHVHLPSKYGDTTYLLMVMTDKDTVYQQPVRDTIVHIMRLKPGNYKMRIVVDSNHNGHWDTGNLFEKIQPEEVIPFKDQLVLKAGWDNTIDFFKEEKPKKPKPGEAPSPQKRDKP